MPDSQFIEIEKSQLSRLKTLLYFVPWLFILSMKGPLSRWDRFFLVFTAISTFVWAMMSYKENEDLNPDARQKPDIRL